VTGILDESRSAGAVGQTEAAFSVTRQSEDRFLGRNIHSGPGRVFGGLLVAQGLAAGGATVRADLAPHSLHAQFLRPADQLMPLDYIVERIKDGRSFATRLVRVQQEGRLAALLMLSFAAESRGPSRNPLPPMAPAPDACPTLEAWLNDVGQHYPGLSEVLRGRDHPLDIRPVSAPSRLDMHGSRDASLSFWFRPLVAGRADRLARCCALAYASDRFVMTTAALTELARFVAGELMTATLDHSLRIHAEPPEGWLFFRTDNPVAGAGRAFVTGEIWSTDGRLIASVGQEGAIVYRDGVAA